MDNNSCEYLLDPVEISFSILSKKKRTRFTPEEDHLLKSLVDFYGAGNWGIILAHFPSRNKRQVKERWYSYLSPQLKAEPFTDAEDKLLEQKLNEIGKKWVLISKYFPNRTDVALKNRWMMIKRHMKNGGKHQNRKKLTPQSSGPAPSSKTIFQEDKTIDEELSQIDGDFLVTDSFSWF